MNISRNGSLLTPSEVTPAITALFDLSRPTMPRAFTVFDGIIRGQIVVDSPARPTWAAVRETTYGTLYLGGRIDAPTLAALLDLFCQIGDVGIGCWPDDPIGAMLPPDLQYDGRTLYFPDRSPAVALEPLMHGLPPGYTLAPRDARLLTQSFDYDDTIATFGSLEQALRHTRGMVLLRDDQVVCEAATGAPVRGRIEVGVTTHEAYRGRDLATIACAALIAACEAEGLATWWDCAAQNIASIRLARRLGYHHEREYRYCWWGRLGGKGGGWSGE